MPDVRVGQKYAGQPRLFRNAEVRIKPVKLFGKVRRGLNHPSLPTGGVNDTEADHLVYPGRIRPSRVVVTAGLRDPTILRHTQYRDNTDDIPVQ